MSDTAMDPPKGVQHDTHEPPPAGTALKDAPLQPEDPAPNKGDGDPAEPAPEKGMPDKKQPDDSGPLPEVKEPVDDIGDPAPPKGDQKDVIGGGGAIPIPDGPAPVAREVQPPKGDPHAHVVGGGQELPFTGAETWVLMACAFMLLASGVIFRVSARREAAAAASAGRSGNVDVQFAWRHTPRGPLGGT